MLSGTEGVAAGLARLQVPTVVVTLGARGVCARSPEGLLLQPAFAVDTVDTTGAGDCFCGAMAAALAQARPLAEALRFGAAAAALACTQLGAQASIPQRAEVERLLREQAPEHDAARRAALAAHCGLA
jgi:ribokinase